MQDTSNRTCTQRTLKILRNTALTVLGLILLIGLLVNLTPVQTFLARKAAGILAKKLETTVTIEHVRIDFLNHLLIQGLYISDRSGDTLLYAGEARVRITDWFILRDQVPVLRYVGLHNTFGHLYRKRDSDEWNYQFVIDAFDTGVRDTTRKQNEFELDLKKADFQNVRFHMDDAWVGSDMDIDIGSLRIDANELDLKKRLIDVKTIALKNSSITLRDYTGGRPPTPRKPQVLDTTAFNPGGWVVKVGSLFVKNNAFNLTAGTRAPWPDEFDPEHMAISNIDLDVREISIEGDTIRGEMRHLAAKERCGIVIRKMSADVTVSPNASICQNLYLETNNSKLQHYYAMHYERFPDFTDYIHKVVMVADLSNARIDSRDVAYFAPALRKYPTIVRATGNVAGTVDSLSSRNLYVTDGSSTIKGNLRMIGLPDIYSTFIDFRNGELYTTNSALFRYAPELRKNPGIAFDKLEYVYYKGDFTGYIENFGANGYFVSNLGSIQSNVNLRIPDFQSRAAVYSGTVASNGFELGTLLRQPLLGSIAFRAGVSGAAFDPEHGTMKLNAVINHFDVKGYRYKNITAEGTLARARFEGDLQVDDPNLALSFEGIFNFGGQVLDINARAHLLNSDFRALNLTRDSVHASADFDLNFTGTHIDNFLGYAKLYNIDLYREGHKLDIDSVYINNDIEGGERLLTVESNDLSAKVKGNFQLSTLGNSIQYYIAGYLPNYIVAPLTYSPDQSLTFDVKTRNISSLLDILTPGISGFDSSSLKGSVNTGQQQLSLSARVPAGTVYGIHLKNVAVEGTGNFRQLVVNTDVEKVAVGNDILSASLDAETTLGNDSLSFDIRTNSTEAIGTATITGRAFASGDSLYLQLLPSEFYLNQHRWTIEPGNAFLFAKQYLQIDGLRLKSGRQQIDVTTRNEKGAQTLIADLADIDITMLGNLAGLADYQPSGRINGSVRLDHLYDGLQLDGHIRATDVKMGTDVIGTINLVGSYDAPKQIITLDPQSGVFLGASSIRTAGSMSFDSTNNQLLNGYIQFNEARLAWINPLVSDFLSDMSGRLNGTINIGGSAARPDINGTVSLHTAGTKINIIGTYYQIPSAKLTVDNHSIDFGNISIFDAHNNIAVLTGGIAHDRFRNMRFNRVELQAPTFEVLNLKEHENSTFYGNLTANVKSLTITGDFDDITMRIAATPTERSHIFIPVKTSADVNTYSYVSFKTYGQEEVAATRRKRNKFTLNITGEMNPLAEMTLVMDPATGDLINAKGNGTIQLNVPPDDELKMYGNYQIEEGDYTFTLRQLAFRRNFIINSGSNIAFNGALSNTNLDINAVYTTRARLIDLLNEKDKETIRGTNEERDAKAAQDVNVLLHMGGSLNEPKLSFNIDLAERREGTLAYQKLKQINQNDRELFDQVAALLLVKTFIPQEGWGGSTTATATSGAINNISELISTTASSQLTNIVNKLLGDPDLSVELKYKNYNLSDPTVSGGVNRNEISFGVRKNLFDDRLVVELGSAYDWGRPTSSNSTTSNLNLAGDFRVQYLLTEDGRVRLNAFRTSNYDVLVDRSIWRGGIGISYRRTFNNLYEFFHRPKPTIMPLLQESRDSTQQTAQGTF